MPVAQQRPVLTAPYVLEQRVLAGGYMWGPWPGIHRYQDIKTGEVDDLTMILVPREFPSEKIARVYDPFRDEPGLFRLFAELEGAMEMLEFAAAYGPFDHNTANHLHLPGGEPVHEWTYPDTMDVWMNTQRELAGAVVQLDAILDQRAGLAADDGRRVRMGPNLLATAEESLASRIQVNMQRASFRLLIDRSQTSAKPPVHADARRRTIRYDTVGGDTPLSMRIAPQTLREVMWLQLAQCLTGERILRKCEVCTRWFDIGPAEDGRKREKIYCSSRCRQKAYRRRVERIVTAGLAHQDRMNDCGPLPPVRRDDLKSEP